MHTNAIPLSAQDATTRPELRALLLYLLRLGTLGFGGPIALVGYMQRDLVENRKWVSREDYLEGPVWPSSRSCTVEWSGNFIG
jgi:hypothetical protein